MARTSVLTGGNNSAQITAEDLNRIATDFVADGVVGTLTNTSGVAPMTGGLAVNAQGTPNTTSAISAGIAYVTATPNSQASQRLRVSIDAQNYTHSANSTGSTRYDWIYVAVSPTLAANPDSSMATVGTIVVSRSTSSSTDNGTPPTYGYCIAVVTLANGFSTVTNGNITDKRTQTGAKPGSASILSTMLSLASGATGGVASYTPTIGTVTSGATASATGWYINLGGLKLCWINVSVTDTTAGTNMHVTGVTLPSSFFNTVQLFIPAIQSEGNAANQHISGDGVSGSQLGFYIDGAFNGSGCTVGILLIGT